MEKESNWYLIGAWLVGSVVFLYIWLIYATGEWGLLLGITFGWVPGLILGFLGGLLWPVIALVFGYIFLTSL